MDKSNRLFLFQPCKEWEYCGGAALICAASLEDAIRIGNEFSHLISEGGTFHEEGGGLMEWSFVREFLLRDPMDVGIVFSDANYA